MMTAMPAPSSPNIVTGTHVGLGGRLPPGTGGVYRDDPPEDSPVLPRRAGLPPLGVTRPEPETRRFAGFPDATLRSVPNSAAGHGQEVPHHGVAMVGEY
jgi:hypothetical protein